MGVGVRIEVAQWFALLPWGVGGWATGPLRGG